MVLRYMGYFFQVLAKHTVQKKAILIIFTGIQRPNLHLHLVAHRTYQRFRKGQLYLRVQHKVTWLKLPSCPIYMI